MSETTWTAEKLCKRLYRNDGARILVLSGSADASAKIARETWEEVKVRCKDPSAPGGELRGNIIASLKRDTGEPVAMVEFRALTCTADVLELAMDRSHTVFAVTDSVVFRKKAERQLFAACLAMAEDNLKT